MRDGRRSAMLLRAVRNPELVPLFATALAVEITHLRWVLLTQWKCRGCKASHLECSCRHGWLKRYL
jgi:hypothetical protein